MQISRSVLICGLSAGFVLSAYALYIKFRGILSRRDDKEKAQKPSKMFKSTKHVKPLRMWIDGKCFNIKRFQRKAKKTKQKAVICTELDNKQSLTEEFEVVDIQFKNEVDIVTEDNGKHRLSFQLPPIYYIKLHQFTEFDHKCLSDRTQTIISWPKQGSIGKLTIEGNDKRNVEDAANEIHSVIGAIREQFAATQFISIPILSPEVKTNFEKFKTEILSGPAISGMHESIFQKALKLHITVIVFALSDEREKNEAISALDEYKNTVLCPLLKRSGPLRLRVQGIDCMQSNYKRTDILYANVKLVNETDEVNLQTLVNDIANYFYERGLVLRHTDNVKLHMTLINTKYRKTESPGPSPSHHRKRWVKRESFDATSIMEKYKDFVFGECDLDSIHLSMISTTGEDGFYKPLSIVRL